MTDTNILTTDQEPAIMGPLKRWVRTIFQVVIGGLAAAPLAVLVIPHLSAAQSTKIVAMAAAAVVTVSGIQNKVNAWLAKH